MALLPISLVVLRMQGVKDDGRVFDLEGDGALNVMGTIPINTMGLKTGMAP